MKSIRGPINQFISINRWSTYDLLVALPSLCDLPGIRDPIVTSVSSILCHSPELSVEQIVSADLYSHEMKFTNQIQEAKEFFRKRCDVSFQEWVDRRTASNQKISQKAIYDQIIKQ